MSLEAGMKSLLARRAAELKAGAEPVGWKIGINNADVQRALGIDGSVVGYLVSGGVVQPGSTVSIGDWTGPAIEPEVAIRVGEEGSVAALAPALELVDVDRPLNDIAAVLEGNVFHRGVCFGDESAPQPLAGTSCRLLADGREERATAEMIDPGEIVAYVGRFLSRHGAALEPGERIIAGSLTPPLPMEPGKRYELDLSSLGGVAVASR